MCTEYNVLLEIFFEEVWGYEVSAEVKTTIGRMHAKWNHYFVTLTTDIMRKKHFIAMSK